MTEERFSPRAFMKNRRPEKFSDTILEEEHSIDRSMLEYHLSTITNRSQEVEFQRFAFELAKREVCPNLLPQTGPTGGGDSKVDTETYPVADQLSLIWCSGIGREASQERWGFAISAKEDWRTKLNSDIPKLVNTGRGYVRAFFITNQFVRDKERADVEDTLSKKHGLNVRIFDRMWILDRVFTGKHEKLAIEQLGIAAFTRTGPRKGPLDVQREQELEAIELRIKDATHDNRFSYQIVDDCIETAILARGLNRPRTDVDGRLIMAERVAKEHGTPKQQLLTAAQRA